LNFGFKKLFLTQQQEMGRKPLKGNNMRSLNIDIARLINLAVSNGAISKDDAVQAIRDGLNPATALPINQHCAHWRDEHGHLGSMFLATDKETKALRRSEDQKRVRFNMRSSAAKSQAATTTPGQKLEAQAGVPTFTAEQLAALRKLLSGGGVSAHVDETDFSDIDL